MKYKEAPKTTGWTVIWREGRRITEHWSATWLPYATSLLWKERTSVEGVSTNDQRPTEKETSEFQRKWCGPDEIYWYGLQDYVRMYLPYLHIEALRQPCIYKSINIWTNNPWSGGSATAHLSVCWYPSSLIQVPTYVFSTSGHIYCVWQRGAFTRNCHPPRFGGW